MINDRLILIIAAIVFSPLGLFGVPGRVNWAALSALCLAIAMVVWCTP